jgi:hypothetical protein
MNPIEKYLIDINKTKDINKLSDLETMILAEWHNSDNDSIEDKLYWSLLEYVRLKINLK